MQQGYNNAVDRTVESPVTCVNTVLLRSCCMAAYSPSETISFFECVSDGGTTEKTERESPHVTACV